MMIVRVAEGRERPLTVFTAHDMVFMWSQTHLGAFTTAFYSQRIAGYGENKKSESETPCSASDKIFLENHWTSDRECIMLMHPRRRERPGMPRTCSTSRRARPTCGGGDRGDSGAALERRSRRLPCESGVEHLEN